jgi:hypothetical protein
MPLVSYRYPALGYHRIGKEKEGQLDFSPLSAQQRLFFRGLAELFE